MDVLKPYRARIDVLDDQIVDLLVQRFSVIREVAVVKEQHGIAAVLEDRVRQVIDGAALRVGSDREVADLVREVYTLLVTVSCDMEERAMAQERHLS